MDYSSVLSLSPKLPSNRNCLFQFHPHLRRGPWVLKAIANEIGLCIL